jgi:hypothetical protein
MNHSAFQSLLKRTFCDVLNLFQADATNTRVREGQDLPMLKTVSAILSAAAVAALVTVFLAPGGAVDAGPLAKPDEAVLKTCTQRPWPYLNCVGTSVGNQRIRLVTTDRLTP